MPAAGHWVLYCTNTNNKSPWSQKNNKMSLVSHFTTTIYRVGVGSCFFFNIIVIPVSSFRRANDKAKQNKDDTWQWRAISTALAIATAVFPQQWGMSQLFVNTALTQESQSKWSELGDNKDNATVPAIWHLFFQQLKWRVKSPQPPRQVTTTAPDQTSTTTTGEVPSSSSETIVGERWYQQLQSNWQHHQQQQHKKMQLSPCGSSGTGKRDKVVEVDSSSRRWWESHTVDQCQGISGGHSNGLLLWTCAAGSTKHTILYFTAMDNSSQFRMDTAANSPNLPLHTHSRQWRWCWNRLSLVFWKSLLRRRE